MQSVPARFSCARRFFAVGAGMGRILAKLSTTRSAKGSGNVWVWKSISMGCPFQIVGLRGRDRCNRERERSDRQGEVQ